VIPKLFARLSQKTTFKRFAWKRIYNYLASKYQNVDFWTFMNYGYSDAYMAEKVILETEEEPERYPAQLYHQVAQVIDTTGVKVLEVGSGRGGGASYVMRALKPREMVGLDIADKAINFSNKRHKIPGLSFVQGSAEDLPFSDNHFDLVINVESSHTYGSEQAFYREVKRVLKPGGVFSIADIRIESRVEEFKNNLRQSGMKILEENDISKNVIEAIELGEERKAAGIRRIMGDRKAKLFKQWAGMKNGLIHTELMNSKRSYLHYVLQKE